MVGSGLVLLMGIFLFLNIYTQHGSSVEVPSLVKLTVADAERLLESKSLRLQVVDSVYNDKATPNTILEQFPKAGERVKESRTIYLIINTATPTMVNLHYRAVIGRSLADVQRKFEVLGLRVGSMEYIPGRGENTVAQVKMGSRVVFIEADPMRGIKPPTAPVQIPRGSVIDLVLYKGEDESLKAMPELICLPYSAAELAIKGSGFMIGELNVEAGLVDTANAYISRQEPYPAELSQMGTGVKLWLVRNKPTACDLDLDPSGQ